MYVFFMQHASYITQMKVSYALSHKPQITAMKCVIFCVSHSIGSQMNYQVVITCFVKTVFITYDEACSYKSDTRRLTKLVSRVNTYTSFWVKQGLHSLLDCPLGDSVTLRSSVLMFICTVYLSLFLPDQFLVTITKTIILWKVFCDRRKCMSPDNFVNPWEEVS